MNHNKDNTRRRPSNVDPSHFESEWDRIFGNKDKKDKEEVKEEKE